MKINDRGFYIAPVIFPLTENKRCIAALSPVFFFTRARERKRPLARQKPSRYVKQKIAKPKNN